MRRSTVIYILLLVILAGVYFYLKNRPQDVDVVDVLFTPEAVEYLFNSDNGIPTSIRIESNSGEVIELARNEENTWTVIQPAETPADQGSVEAAMGQITTIRILDHVPDLPKEAIGLGNPEYKMIIHFTGDVERILDVGVLTPTGTGYYAARDDDDILIVGNTGLDSLIDLLANPPYLATETPLPAPSEAGPSLVVTATPQP